MPTVAAAVASILTEAGIRRLYTVPGESFLEFLDEVEREPRLRLVSARHESGAAFMAEADGRVAGVPAVALASRSPGAANLAIGVETAHYDGTPLVAVLGQVESTLLGRGAFQEIDLTAFYAPITKWAVTAEDPDEVPGLVARGLEIATAGRPGPVAVAVPTDFWEETTAWRAAADGGHPAPAGPDDDVAWADVDDVAAALSSASRPVAVVGGGAAGVGEELVAVAERFGLGVYTSFRRQDTFPADHPQYLGHLGIGTPPHLLTALDDADVLVVVGARLDEVTSQGFRYPLPGQPVHRIGSPASRADAAATRRLAAALRAMRERGRPGPAPDWSAQHQTAVRFGTPAPESAPGDGLHPTEVVTAVRRYFPDGAIVTNDAGNFSGFLHRYWRFVRGDVQLGPAIGAMGYAVPAAVGAKLACPERAVLAFVGDGGALMTGQEIETAVRYGAGVVVVAFRNRLYGTIAMHQARRYGRVAGVGIGEVDLAAWARALGAAGYSAGTAGELDAALRAARRHDGPVLVDVRTDPDVIAPSARLSHFAADGEEG